jgi:hypothetical protein
MLGRRFPREIPMRTATTSVLAALLCLPLAACLETKEEFVLAADGSGTIKQKYVADLKATKQLLEGAMMFFGDPSTGGAIPDPLPNPVAPAWLRADAKGVEGYTLSKVEETTADDKRTTVVEAKFTCLEVAAKAGAFFTSSVSLQKTEAGAWKLSLRDAWSKAKEAGGGGDPMANFDVTSVLPVFEEQLKTLRLERSFTLPGKILETNGKKSEDGKTVSWVVDYAKIVAGKDLEMTVVFEGGEGVTLAPFEHKRDLRSLFPRVTESPPKESEEKPAEPAPAPAAPQR